MCRRITLFIIVWFGVLNVRGENCVIEPEHALTLGFTQGFTEFLPVSSTGHMILVNEWFQKRAQKHYGHLLHYKQSILECENVLKNYMVIIQLGTLLVLLLFYWREIGHISKGLCGTDPVGLRLGLKVALAFIPVGLCGFLFDDWIQTHLYNPTCVMLAIFVGGLFIFWLEHYRQKQTVCWNIDTLPWHAALGVGLFQCIALWPGFSRSLATIAGGILYGLSLLQAIKFSFLLDLLTSIVVVAYKFLKHSTELFQVLQTPGAWSAIVLAFVVGLFTIQFFIKYLEHHGLKIFGTYRLLLTLIFIWQIQL